MRHFSKLFLINRRWLGSASKPEVERVGIERGGPLSHRPSSLTFLDRLRTRRLANKFLIREDHGRSHVIHGYTLTPITPCQPRWAIEVWSDEAEAPL